jgi:uncharacterized protein YndB with AHSA1/START domain
VAEIVSDVLINAPPSAVFRGVSTPAGLDAWWTLTSAGMPAVGAEFELGFGPGYEWRARVTRCRPDAEFEIELLESHPDWAGTRVGFRIEQGETHTKLGFYHTGWPEANEHWRTSCYCWPIYLRLLRRNLEHGEVVPYEKRLDV